MWGSSRLGGGGSDCGVVRLRCLSCLMRHPSCVIVLLYKVSVSLFGVGFSLDFLSVYYHRNIKDSFGRIFCDFFARSPRIGKYTLESHITLLVFTHTCSRDLMHIFGFEVTFFLLWRNPLHKMLNFNRTVYCYHQSATITRQYHPS